MVVAAVFMAVVPTNVTEAAKTAIIEVWNFISNYVEFMCLDGSAESRRFESRQLRYSGTQRII